MGRVVSPTPTPLSSGRVVPALVASYDMHGRAVGLFYTQPTGQEVLSEPSKSGTQAGRTFLWQRNQREMKMRLTTRENSSFRVKFVTS